MLNVSRFLIRLKKLQRVNLLGLDVGRRFIGLARADDVFGKYQISPIVQIDKKMQNFISEIFKNASGIHGIVVGKSEFKNEMDKVIEDTVKMIENDIELPMVYWNEDYSTVKATEMLYKIRPRYGKSKFLIDQVAACVVLEDFIQYAQNAMPNLPDLL
ncbi:hypothetical protein SteCoe_22417 [Stentor coeruleus]|uniref:YqgF/RNase H-like domain-containing protein n=1 Tax=Stentor coeruleus TaxID=5963 RepID=A0A1R2BM79_9CILI|nr:hypothetical protein SteCoe_22417 [Stentor coeruleus]